MGKNDPYKEFNEALKKMFVKLADMIVWVARRTLTAKEFEQFLKEFYEEKQEG